jgi:adenosine kinase
MDILLTGSIAYDYLMQFPGYFRDHILPDSLESISLSFLVESLTRRRGGVAPNIAYTLALLGARPRLMATVGEDFDDYRTWLEAHGIDTSHVHVIPGVFTASFFANTDRANAQIASFYPGAMAYASQLSFYKLDADLPDLVMISPNDPVAMKQYIQECRELDIPYMYDPSQQTVRLSGEELCDGIQSARALFVNDYEFRLIRKMTSMSEKDILEHIDFLVVTCGEHGTTIHTQSGHIHIPAVPPLEIADPTGVGDAFRGGFLAGYVRGWDLETCGRMGALAATYCLEQQGSQGHHYTPAEFIARARQHFDDGGSLDALLEESST